MEIRDIIAPVRFANAGRLEVLATVQQVDRGANLCLAHAIQAGAVEMPVLL